MNRRLPLILVNQAEMVSSGLWPDRHPMQTPLWTDGVNVRFYSGKVSRRVPNATAFDAGDGPVRGISQHQNSNGTRWVWAASGGRIVRWYGPSVEQIATGAYRQHSSAALPATLWDFTHWGDWTIFNNREYGVRIHRAQDGTVGPLLNAPTDAVVFLKKRNQLLAVGHGLNGKLVSFSDADNIEEWAATPANLAGELPLEELDTPVKAACHFGPNIAVFGENQMFSVNWIGAPFYFGQQKLLDGIGAVGKFSVVSDGRIIYGVGRNGVWRTDGVSFSYIDEVILQDYLQRNVNWDQASKIIALKNDITGCLEFSFPMGASLDPSEAWSYDPRYGGWSQVPSFTMAQSRVVLQRPLAGTEAGLVELLEYDDAGLGPLLLETRAMLAQGDASALHIGALIDEIELFTHRADNVQFRYGTAQTPDGPWAWSSWSGITAKQVTYQPDRLVSGVYHKLQFESVAAEWDLDLQGFALFGVVDGQKRKAN